MWLELKGGWWRSWWDVPIRYIQGSSVADWDVGEKREGITKNDSHCLMTKQDKGLVFKSKLWRDSNLGEADGFSFGYVGFGVRGRH